MEKRLIETARIFESVEAIDYCSAINTIAYATDKNKLTFLQLSDNTETKMTLKNSSSMLRFCPSGSIIASVFGDQKSIDLMGHGQNQFRATISDWARVTELNWNRDATRLVVTSELGTKVSVYDLESERIGIIPNSKLAKKCTSISESTGLLAVLISKDNAEWIEIVDLDSISHLSMFKIETKGAYEISFGPDDLYLLVREENFKQQILIYQLDGYLVHKIYDPQVYISKWTFSKASEAWPLVYCSSTGSIFIFHLNCFHDVFQVSAESLAQQASRSDFICLREFEINDEYIKKKRNGLLTSRIHQVRQTPSER